MSSSGPSSLKAPAMFPPPTCNSEHRRAAEVGEPSGTSGRRTRSLHAGTSEGARPGNGYPAGADPHVPWYRYRCADDGLLPMRQLRCRDEGVREYDPVWRLQSGSSVVAPDGVAAAFLLGGVRRGLLRASAEGAQRPTPPETGGRCSSGGVVCRVRAVLRAEEERCPILLKQMSSTRTSLSMRRRLGRGRRCGRGTISCSASPSRKSRPCIGHPLHDSPAVPFNGPSPRSPCRKRTTRP
jgi:hypothetical protein